MDALAFWKKYKLISSSSNFERFNSATRKCRFCGNNEDKATFNTQTHIVPELLGENNFISNDECDECNSKFSAYESHLSIFLRPYLTLSGVKGKRKIPEFQSRSNNGDEKTRTIIKAEGNTRHILLNSLDDYKINKKNKTVSITFRKPPHKLLNVYKSFVKIGLSILPLSKLSLYENTFGWLLGKDENITYFVTAFITILTHKRIGKPFAELYEFIPFVDNQVYLPELTLLLGSGNMIIQIFLPLSSSFNLESSKEKKPELNVYPAFALDDCLKMSKAVVSAIDLKGNESITTDQTIHLSYLNGEFNIGEEKVRDF